MKKISILMMAVAAMTVVACSSNIAKYDVTGVNAPQDGAVVYCFPSLEDPQQSCKSQVNLTITCCSLNDLNPEDSFDHHCRRGIAPVPHQPVDAEWKSFL